MNEEIVLSPREQKILKLFADLGRLAADFSSKPRSELAREAVETNIPASDEWK